MKRKHIFLAVGISVSIGALSGCSQDPVQPDAISTVNPHHGEAQTLVSGLITHVMEYAEGYQGPRAEPGTILLEAMDSYEPLYIDLDVDVAGRTMQLARSRDAGKAPSERPFEQEEGLTEGQKRYLHQAFDVAGHARSSVHLKRALARVEASAVRDLGAQRADPILATTALMYAQYSYYTDPANQEVLGALVRVLHEVAGTPGEVSRSRFSFVRVQQVTPPNPNTGGNQASPPPLFGDFFNPGTWWRNTLEDTRETAEIGVLAGAGVGCIAGAVGLVGAGCGPAGAAGGLIGGLGGTILGLVTGGLANLAESAHEYSMELEKWCEDQRALAENLRDRRYERKCGSKHQ